MFSYNDGRVCAGRHPRLYLAKGGEVSGRAVAWLGFTVATASMLVPVMLNHNLIPEGKLRQLVGQVIATAETAQAAAAAAPSDS